MKERFSERYLEFWEVIRQVPEGKVATYGQIAALAGYPGNARQVGYSLHASPPEIDIPWHRIINAQGKISLPKESGHYDLQRSLLEKEGVIFKNERVNLRKYRWQP